MIPFNKPFLTGKEAHYMYDAVYAGKISGNGKYTQMSQRWFEDTYHFGKCLLTTSCTDALEMAAILADIQPGDEVILPSYTFVSTANAFVLRGAKLVFTDSRNDHPGMNESDIRSLITPKTKAIVPVHYAGVACDMDSIMDIAEKHNILVIEDAAQAIDSYYIGKEGQKKPLGGIGHMAAFSFHETKNIISGEGGMLVINDKKFEKRAEIIWEKGTNRTAYFRGEVDKYNWVDIGSSFLPSEVTSAFLWAQIEHITMIQKKRMHLWNQYRENLQDWAYSNNIKMPILPAYASNNAHMFYLVCPNSLVREKLIEHLKNKNVNAVFHYISLHSSPFYKDKHDGRQLPETERYSDCLVRLPLWLGVDIQKVIQAILSFNH
jgi:dTDP-4-amino-4,6-dideoxygalactose transaminase